HTPDPSRGRGRRPEPARDRPRLKQALLQLPDEKRELLVLARFHGMKHEQIAELLGIETGAVKVRIHRALRELREIFLKKTNGNPSCDVKRSTRTLQII